MLNTDSKIHFISSLSFFLSFSSFYFSQHLPQKDPSQTTPIPPCSTISLPPRYTSPSDHCRSLSTAPPPIHPIPPPPLLPKHQPTTINYHPNILISDHQLLPFHTFKHLWCWKKKLRVLSALGPPTCFLFIYIIFKDVSYVWKRKILGELCGNYHTQQIKKACPMTSYTLPFTRTKSKFVGDGGWGVGVGGVVTSVRPSLWAILGTLCRQ